MAHVFRVLALGAMPPTKMAEAVYVAATKQFTGKTTTCCALLSGLQTRFPRVGYMKPVGQVDEVVLDANGQEAHVDKDVRLFREYFKLHHCDYYDMSPVMIRSGYTKRFLDGEVDPQKQLADIQRGFSNLQRVNDFMVVEGTGHCGVGSIIGLDNAWVAKQLGLDMVLICSAGLGSTFDELMLNQLKCEQHDVKIRGVIMNRVRPSLMDKTREYLEKALARWNVPLIGCVPYYTYFPTLADLENLFDSQVHKMGGNMVSRVHRPYVLSEGVLEIRRSRQCCIHRPNSPHVPFLATRFIDVKSSASMKVQAVWRYRGNTVVSPPPLSSTALSKHGDATRGVGVPECSRISAKPAYSNG